MFYLKLNITLSKYILSFITIVNLLLILKCINHGNGLLYNIYVLINIYIFKYIGVLSLYYY